MIKKLRVLVAAGLLAVSSAPAFAVDPTYTSQIKDALGAVNMTGMATDIGSFAGVGFLILLAPLGVFFVSKILKRFLA